MAGQLLRDALAVWVGVSGTRGAVMPVRWSVVTGGGNFSGVFPSEYGVSRSSADGTAYVWFQPAAPGPITVVAEVAGGSRVVFTLRATPGPVMEVISGGGQQGLTAEFLGEPLVIRVSDLEGRPLPNLAVKWSIGSGAGEFGVGEGCTDSCKFTRSDAAGLASITFEPWSPGQSRVVAEIPAAQGSPAFFEVSATGLPSVIIRFGPEHWCEDEPSNFQLPVTSMPVGTLVIFENPTCWSLVRSTNVPPGATPFDSGILKPGERYAITVDKPGLWAFEDVWSGGRAQFTVVTP
jgi:hypothetical protein